MKIAITGASGMLGSRMMSELAGHSLVAVGRKSGTMPSAVDAVIHLAGEPVAQRWTAEAKRRILESREAGTRKLVDAFAQMTQPPQTLVCASAIGIYGSRGDEVLTEASSPGQGFLPEVCLAWEREADRAASLGVRVVKLRIGIVLAREGGALARMLPPFRAGVGGPLGSGRQWMSWIHIDDVVGLMRHALEHAAMEGPVNATAPLPVINAEFVRMLGKSLHRPAIVPAPAFALRLLFGEMSEVLLGSQRVLPAAADAAHYQFRHPELGAALRDLLG
jgi:uncharacterized protein (TIGR01777 family)